MPSQPAAYQRILIEGVPYWKESATGNLFYYESSVPPTTEPNRICLGTESTGLFADWQTRLEDTLKAYRTTATSRARAASKAT